jgi:hypothetical protein
MFTLIFFFNLNPITTGFLDFRYKINRDVDEGVFLVSFGLKICAGECFLKDYFLNDIKIPIPLCGEFVLPGIYRE